MTASDLGADVLGWLDAPLNFVARPDPVAPNDRPERRIALCLMVVDKSWGGRATWKAVHVLSWALKSHSRLEMVARLRDGTGPADRPVVRFDPALDRALDLAVGLGFLARSDAGVFSLTPVGQDALSEVRAAGLFVDEEEALTSVKGKISNSSVERLLEWRTK
ncbi:hypothetical protein [Nocardioides jiangxiensis]|uniref:Uncharacterized protein n=1 Tax=Nocardioides jiangxiensis TaxID=3064524 RepID=A0ABT9AZX6_9ACTN|nr:hypothetical protein [Nocardioides sp. WY-20]MDO7868152.1 hypothetical protein [Nocardioides sp. WY-20]